MVSLSGTGVRGPTGELGREPGESEELTRKGLFGESLTGIGLAGRLRGGVTGGRGRVGGGERSDHVVGTDEAGTARDCDNLLVEVACPRREDEGGLPLETERGTRDGFDARLESSSSTGAPASQKASSRSSALSSATTASILRRLCETTPSSSDACWLWDGEAFGETTGRTSSASSSEEWYAEPRERERFLTVRGGVGRDATDALRLRDLLLGGLTREGRESSSTRSAMRRGW